MNILNPATDSIIGSYTPDNWDTISSKFNEAKKGQILWSKTDLKTRLACIAKFSDLMKEERDQLALDLTKEVGKPIQESYNEINGGRARIQFFLEEAQKVLDQTTVRQDGNTEEVLAYDPLGVIANISAWNYPWLVGINVFVPALICGNAVLYKPSEFSTLTGQHITRLLHKAGIPQNTFISVYGDGKVGSWLLELPINGLFFTGSYQTGQKLAQAVASKLIPVGLELGGKDPLYVTDDVADIAQVAQAAAEGVFYNNGQSCCSVERLYVHKNTYDLFIAAFLNEVKKLKVGNPQDKNIQQGAITRKPHLAVLEDQVRDALSKGATLAIGGKTIQGPGNFFEPTVLLNVNHSMKVMKDESFGPIIGIMKVANDKEAIELMNDTCYGLTSSVYTRDTKRGKEILSQINSGTGYLNCCDRVSAWLPWAGRGHSGLGQTLSKHGIYAFCNTKGYHLRK